jgi:hypothetical protein
MSKKALLLALALSLYVAQSLQARDVNPVLLSTYPPPLGGTTTDVAVSGNFVYACEGEKGLIILDVTNPSNPQLVGTAETPGFASAVVVSENLAFVADGSTGLTIIDVSQSNTSPRPIPFIIGSYDTPGNCTSVAVAGKLAYLADGSYGLQIIDCSNPAQPVRLGGYNTFGTALSVAISGNFAYIADGENGFVVIDVSNPTTPRKIAGYAAMSGRHVAVGGAYAYVSSNRPLAIIDISDPLDPEPISSVALPGIVAGCSVSQSYAYVASGIGGFHVLDTSDPFAPRTLGTTSLLTNTVRVATAGPLAFVADLTNGVRVIAAQNPAVMDVIAHIPIPGNIRDLVVSSNYVYLFGSEGMQIVDVSNAEDMRVVGSYSGFRPTSGAGITVFNQYAFLIDLTSSIGYHEIVKISEPTTPIRVGTGYTGYGDAIKDFKGDGEYLYLGASRFRIERFAVPNGLEIVGAVSQPVAVSTYLTNYFFPDVLSVRGTNGWGVGTQGGYYPGPFIYNIDISSPSSPRVISGANHSDWNIKAAQMQISETNGFVLLSQQDQGHLQAVRIFDLGSLGDVASRPVNAVQKFDVATNTIYLAKGSNGVEVLRLEGNVVTSVGGAGLPDATAIATTPKNVFVGAGTNGLYALSHYQPAVRLEMALNTNRAPLLKAFGPIGSSGRLQRATNISTISFQDWQSLQLDSYPQILTDMNSARGFYRFVSP